MSVAANVTGAVEKMTSALDRIMKTIAEYEALRWPPGIGDAPWCLCKLVVNSETVSAPGTAAIWPTSIVITLHPRCPMHRKMSRRERRNVERRILGRAGRLHGMPPTDRSPTR